MFKGHAKEPRLYPVGSTQGDVERSVIAFYQNS